MSAPIPLDSDEVYRDLSDALDKLEVWLLDDDAIDPLPDRLRLYALLVDASGNGGRIAVVKRALGERLAPDLPGTDPGEEPVEVDGRVWRRGRSKSVTGVRREQLRDKLTGLALAKRRDVETGRLRNPKPAEVVVRMWTFADVADKRTKVLADLGIDLDEYAEVKWTDIVEEIK